VSGKTRGYEDPFLERVSLGPFRIDSEGRIWKLSDHGSSCKARRAERGKPGDYQQVRIKIGDRYCYVSAHRAVFRYFYGPIPAGIEVNHDNGIKDDNRPANLVLSTCSGNVKHAHANGLIDQFGQKNPAAKLSDNQVAQIRLAYSKGGYTMEQLGVKFGVSFKTISKIARGQRRPKQGGPIQNHDLHRNVCDRNSITGQFVGKKAAGRLLDGREYLEFPEVRG